MFRLAIFLIILFAAAIGFAWLADRPGSVTVEWPWLGMIVEVTLLRAVIGLAAIVAIIMAVWWVLSGIWRSPETFGRWRSGRRRDKGYAALSRGLVAAGAGNASLARQLTKESSRYLDNEPMVKMLDAQTALLEGKRDVARSKYEAMLEDDDTKLLGLRGLYDEAEREGNGEAAGHFAREGYAVAPETPWAAIGLLKVQGNLGDWTDALKTLDANRASGMYEREEYSRKRAVILTALGNQVEDEDPDKARTHALAAHKLAPDLVPAAVTAARLSRRLKDERKAKKVLQNTWTKSPHPEVGAAYLELASGDSAVERLKLVEKLIRKNEDNTESRLLLAGAALDANEFSKARAALSAVLDNDPSERACLLMADLDEAEHGDRGRVSEWLARAVTAPRDPVWTADGIVSEHWAPISPISGQLDAFEWKIPVEQVGGADRALDYSNIPAHSAPEPVVEPEAEDDEPTTIEIAQAAVATTVAAGAVGVTAQSSDAVSHAIEETHAMPSGGAVLLHGDSKENPDSDQDDDGNHIEDAEIIDTDDGKLTINRPEADESIVDTKAALSADRDYSERAQDAVSPFKNVDFDKNKDGQIDHRPDDPGPRVKKKKKNFFF